MKKGSTRVYGVEGDGNTLRLVRASSRAQAISHVARSRLTAKVASQDDIIEAMSAGAVVETANEDQQQELA